MRRDVERLCVDIDNVLCDSDSAMRRIIADVTDGHVDLRYEDVRFFDYRLCPDVRGNRPTDEQWRIAHKRFSSEEVIEGLEPIPGAFESLGTLSGRYMIHFVTSRKPIARASTATWLESRVGSYPHDLHFVTPGEKHHALSRFSASVEDQLSQAVAFARSGIRSFVLAHPWNTVERVGAAFPLSRLEDWTSIMEELLDESISRPNGLEIL